MTILCGLYASLQLISAYAMKLDTVTIAVLVFSSMLFWLCSIIGSRTTYSHLSCCLRNSYATLITLFLTVIALLLSFPGYATAQPPLKLSTQSQAKLAGHLEMLVDPGGKLALTEVLAPQNTNRFVAIPGDLNRSYTRDTIWLRTRVMRSGQFPEQSWLRLGPSYIDTINVYLQTGTDASLAASYREIRMGDHVPVDQRPVRHPEFVLPVTLPPNTETTILVQIRTTSTLNLEGAFYTTSALLTHDTNYLVLQGGYLGIAIIIALVNLIYFMRIGDRLFLYFGLYIFALFGQQLGMDGLIALLWPSHAHHISDYLVGSLIGASILMHCLFAMRLFTNVRNRFVSWYLWSMVIIGVITILSVPLDMYSYVAPFAMLGTIGVILIMTWLSISAVRKGEPAGMLYLAAFGVSNLGYSVQIFRGLGLLPIAWWNVYGVQISSLFNMVMMTLALTERLRLAEEKAIVAARDAEQNAVDMAKAMTVELRDKQRDLETALAAEQQMLERKNQFLSMISHEYRTPLAIIQANMEILELSVQPEERTDNCFSKMTQAMKRLREIFDQNLRHSKLEQNLTLKLEMLSISELVGEALEEAEKMWGAARFSLVGVGGDSFQISADSRLLKTSLLNLLDNAVKYSPVDSLIIVSLDANCQEVCIQVESSMPETAQIEISRIFEEFYRGNNASGVTGTGVGLYLVRRIIVEHGGTASVDTTEGLFRITLKLPRHVEA